MNVPAMRVPAVNIALDEDFHVHSAFSDDAESSVAENVAAATLRGLRTLCVADHVRRDTPWVGELAAAVAKFQDAPGPRVLAGVEAKILDSVGRLDLPDELGGIDLVLIADHQFPWDDGPVHPDQVRAAIGGGELTGAEAIERLCAATEAAVRTTDRGRVLVHLFSLLPKIGLSEDMVPAALLTRLAAQVAQSGAMVEVNEKWACPSARTVTAMMRAGVPVVAGSDSHHCRDVGVYRSVAATAAKLSPAPGSPASESPAAESPAAESPAADSPASVSPASGSEVRA
ncbi:MAG TPA: PHP domain-containing protein [Trebonia sp.]